MTDHLLTGLTSEIPDGSSESEILGNKSNRIPASELSEVPPFEYIYISRHAIAPIGPGISVPGTKITPFPSKFVAKTMKR